MSVRGKDLALALATQSSNAVSRGEPVSGHKASSSGTCQSLFHSVHVSGEHANNNAWRLARR